MLPGGTWIHFDIEVNPLVDPSKVYLWGLLKPPYDSSSFDYAWSDGSEEEDFRAWENFLKYISQYRTAYENVVLAHYSHYERTFLKTYAKRFSMEGDPIVSWLLGEKSPLFDLCKVIRESFALPTFGYGLKAVCKDKRIVDFQWELGESGSQWSVVRYADYLSAPDHERSRIKDEILSYNRDDVRATRALEVWVRSRAGENSNNNVSAGAQSLTQN